MNASPRSITILPAPSDPTPDTGHLNGRAVAPQGPAVITGRSDGSTTDALRRHVEQVGCIGGWVWSESPGVVTVSSQVHRVLGTGPDVPPTLSGLLARVLPGDRARVTQVLAAAAAHGGHFSLDVWIERPDGEIREIQLAGRAEGTEAGSAHLIGSVMDVTRVRAAARDLLAAEQLSAGVIGAGIAQAIVGVDTDGTITVFNAGAELMFGRQGADMVGKATILDIHDQEQLASGARALGLSPLLTVLGRAAAAESETAQWTYRSGAGGSIHCGTTITAMIGVRSEITGYICVITDLAAQHESEKALRISEALFEDIFFHAPGGMLLTDLTGADPGRLVRVNPALTRITGYPAAELLGMSIIDLTHPDHRPAHLSRLNDLAAGRGCPAEVEGCWVRADGREIWVQFSLSPVGSGQISRAVGMVEDITTRRQPDIEVDNHWTLHDALTGLPNRSLLLDRLEQAVGASSRSSTGVGVLHINLDDFTAVNDAHGHLVGDQLLVMVARRLNGHIRPGDTVARIGGDDFVVLCPEFVEAGPGADRTSHVRAIADRLLTALDGPYRHGGIAHRLSASIGVTTSRPGSTPTALLRAAADAMFIAKIEGKNRTSAHNATTGRNDAAEAGRHARVQRELLKALEHEELVLHGQPVLNLVTGEVVAVEMLIRWQHPTLGLLSPDRFLDVAETSPLMPRIGQWVLKEACRIAATWAMPNGGRPPTVFVNISGRQMEPGTLLADVLSALNTSLLPASRLVLELTETCTPLIAGTLLADLDDLRKRGVRLAIDDVGTGYSSLARLTELPIDILKIDRSFIAQIGQQGACDAVIQAILGIRKALGLHVVAEGVETSSQARTLVQYGCDTAQGFLYSKALPEGVLHRLLAAPSTWGPVSVN